MASRTCLPFFASLLFLFPITDASGTVRTVRQDGSGDFTTISAAVAIATAGDVIDVGPGIYPEKVDVYVTLTFTSIAGAAATIVDGEGTHYPLWFRGGTGHVVDGFTFRNGYHVSGGGAIRCMGSATLTIRNSVIEDNISEYDGGGFFTRDPGALIDAHDCVFRRNHAARNAGAGIAILGSRINYTRCSFFDNTGGVLTGGVTADRSAMDVTNCLFVGNVSASAGSAVYYHMSSGNVVGNTLSANQSGYHGSVLIQDSPATNVTRNIIVGDTGGAGLAYFYSTGAHSCNVFSNNADGPVVGGSLAADEDEADPVFCGAAVGDYTISIQSPAAPAHSACGQLIGAFPTNCDIAPPPPPPPPVIEPVILGITDVPNDQGRQVRIRWERADYDAPSQPFTITGYAIYRFQGDFARLQRPAVAAGRGPGVRIDGWDYISTVPARGDEIYQAIAPTLCDTRKNRDPCPSVFFVSAMTPDPLTFFDSEPDTGESFDNLPPHRPMSLDVRHSSAGAKLEWEGPDDPDVVQYFVFRTNGSELESNTPIVHATAGLEWLDPDGTLLARYFVAAVDDAGNVGDAISAQSTTGTGPGPVPGAFYLAQNAPNPFNPSTSIEFGLPAGGGGMVTLEVFDVVGRRITTLLREHRDAGTWRVTWDGSTDAGSRASSGVYFYRLRTAKFEKTQRMTLVE